LRIAFGSDDRTHLTDFIEQELRSRGHQVELVGPPAGQPLQWTDVARAVAERVASARADEGLLCCWTGTGVSIAANKLPGVRAALCNDAETARGARAWNDANLLCLSLRTTTEALAREVLDAWFSARPEESEAANVKKLNELDRRYRATSPSGRDAIAPAEGEKGRV
jgi:ribose 5-phosphate isomerase B